MVVTNSRFSEGKASELRHALFSPQPNSNQSGTLIPQSTVTRDSRGYK